MAAEDSMDSRDSKDKEIKMSFRRLELLLMLQRAAILRGDEREALRLDVAIAWEMARRRTRSRASRTR